MGIKRISTSQKSEYSFKNVFQLKITCDYSILRIYHFLDIRYLSTWMEKEARRRQVVLGHGDKAKEIVNYDVLPSHANPKIPVKRYASRTLKRAGKIVADPSHPGRKLYQTLPSGRSPH